MPGLFLGSNLFKRGVSWRGFKGSVIFALGYHAHGVVFPNPVKVIEEIEQTLAEALSLAKEHDTQRAELIEKKKVVDDLMQLYRTRIAEVEELRKANGLGNLVVNRWKNLSGVSYEETDQEI